MEETWDTISEQCDSGKAHSKKSYFLTKELVLKNPTHIGVRTTQV